MAAFRCKRSGNTITLTLPADVEGTRKHEGYVEIVEDENGLQKEIQAPTEEVIHKPLLNTVTKYSSVLGDLAVKVGFFFGHLFERKEKK